MDKSHRRRSLGTWLLHFARVRHRLRSEGGELACLCVFGKCSRGPAPSAMLLAEGNCGLATWTFSS